MSSARLVVRTSFHDGLGPVLPAGAEQQIIEHPIVPAGKHRIHQLARAVAVPELQRQGLFLIGAGHAAENPYPTPYGKARFLLVLGEQLHMGRPLPGVTVLHEVGPLVGVIGLPLAHSVDALFITEQPVRRRCEADHVHLMVFVDDIAGREDVAGHRPWLDRYRTHGRGSGHGERGRCTGPTPWWGPNRPGYSIPPPPRSGQPPLSARRCKSRAWWPPPGWLSGPARLRRRWPHPGSVW